MSDPIRIGLAGAGAFGQQHMAALSDIPEAKLVTVAERNTQVRDALREERPDLLLVKRYEDLISRNDVDAVILATPTPAHASQAVAAMSAGKHVMIEIPLADNWADAQEVQKAHRRSHCTCMVSHTRRFNASHQWVKARIDEGALNLQSMVAETFFFRRANINAKGEARDWTDHLLWHHAAHSIDLFQYMTGSPITEANVVQGPAHPELGIAMDMSIQLRTEAGQVLTLALSFNNNGPLGTRFRYIGDSGTYLAHYDDLTDGFGKRIDLSEFGENPNGVVLQDREFVSAIQSGTEPKASLDKTIDCYRLLGQLADQLSQ